MLFLKLLLIVFIAVILFILIVKYNLEKKIQPRKIYFNEEKKPLIIGHRGILSIDVENSIPSFNLIKKFNIDGTELDANLTKDKKLIVFHDFNLLRVFGVNKKISDLNYSEIRKFKLINFSNELEEIPLLEEVLKFLKDVKLINIEIKSNTLFSNGIEKEVYKVIKKLNLEKKVIVSSFNPFSLYRFKKIAPEILRGLLLSKENVPFYIKNLWFWEFAAPDYIHFHADYLNELIVYEFDKKGYGTVFWGIDNLNLFKRAINHKPQIIISNIPHILKKYN